MVLCGGPDKVEVRIDSMFSRQKNSKVSQAGGVLGIIALLMVLLTACTFTNDHTTHAGTRQVRITEDEFHIASSVKTFAPGVPYHFVIKNNGRTTHEFMMTP